MHFFHTVTADTHRANFLFFISTSTTDVANAHTLVNYVENVTLGTN